jgi:glycosyltransferase involved in cell wall biosynthesis
MARRVRRGLAPPRTLDGVHVLAPLVLPLHGRPAVRAVNRRLLSLLVGRAARRLGMERPILWAYVPQAEDLLDALDPGLVVYHCVDDIAAQEGVDGDSFRAAERRFAARADLVLASAPALRDRMAEISAHVLYAPNVADTESFARALEPGPVDPALDALPGPRLVFTGAITETKLDAGLLVELARRRRDWTLALVGPVGLGAPHTDVAALDREPNIHLLGQRPYAELPGVLRGADAAIIPYLRTRLTDSIFPMKIYEYLAAGLPVVTTELPSLEGVPEVVRARDADGFERALERLLAGDGDELRRQRSREARRHSWDARLTEISEAIAAREARDD